MIKNKVVLEVQKEERLYSFLCDVNSPLGEIYDVLFMMKAEIFARLKAAEEAEKPPEPKVE